MANPTVIKLQDGNVMPQLGLGVWQASNEEVITAIQKALEVGYRSIDTAAATRTKKVSAKPEKMPQSTEKNCSSPLSCGTTTTSAPAKPCSTA